MRRETKGLLILFALSEAIGAYSQCLWPLDSRSKPVDFNPLASVGCYR